MTGAITSPANPSLESAAEFDGVLTRQGLGRLWRERAPKTFQVNLGKLCNQACHHCHVDASPKRTEVMQRATAQRVLELLIKSPSINQLDITGGAPELNPNFSWIVEQSRRAGYSVMVRCNLTVLFEPGMERLADFYREWNVHLVCSLPCYSRENVEQQRGAGVFSKSIMALQQLNRLGYGDQLNDGLKLDLVYNPIGPSLPPPQAQLEAQYREELGHNFGIVFDHLFTITNMPINRFARQLQQWGKFSEYMGLLVNHFNPATVNALMCRELVSVSWDGRLFDCDFNQMLEMPITGRTNGRPLSIWQINDLGSLKGAPIATGSHCFGCTAGSGSSCGGALT